MSDAQSKQVLGHRRCALPTRPCDPSLAEIPRRGRQATARSPALPSLIAYAGYVRQLAYLSCVPPALVEPLACCSTRTWGRLFADVGHRYAILNLSRFERPSLHMVVAMWQQQLS
jgi:hypothetical protein